MRISDAIGLFGALIGLTATVLGAWGYIRAQRPSKRELFRLTLTIAIIMVCILSFAVLVSRATTIKINGQENIPVGPLVPGEGGSTPAPGLTPSLSPSPSPSLSPTVPMPTLLPSPAATPTKTGGQ